VLTGTGASIAANKAPSARAVLCADVETAKGARMWNGANVLCMSLRLTSPAVSSEVLDGWFEAGVDEAELVPIDRSIALTRSMGISDV
jgi:ribose 5-phosphate isomerase B